VRRSSPREHPGEYPAGRDPSHHDRARGSGAPARQRVRLRGLGYGFLILCFCLSLPLLERDVLARILGGVAPFDSATHGGAGQAPPPVVADVRGSARLDVSAAPYGATEIPPWIVPGGWRGYTLSTDHALYCPSPANLLTGPVRMRKADCSLLVGRSTYSYDRNASLSPSADYSGSLWRKDYYGSFSGQVALPDTPNAMLLSVNHGENKNEVLAGLRYQSEVNADVPAGACASGYDGVGWSECWRAYNGFVGQQRRKAESDTPNCRIDAGHAPSPPQASHSLRPV